MYADGLISPMQTCFSDLVQPLVTSYVIDAYICLVMLHAWTWSTSTLCSASNGGHHTKAEKRRPPGRPRNVWLNKIQEDANALLLSTLWRSEIARVTERRNGSLGLRDDDDDNEGCTTCVKNGGYN